MQGRTHDCELDLYERVDEWFYIYQGITISELRIRICCGLRTRIIIFFNFFLIGNLTIIIEREKI